MTHTLHRRGSQEELRQEFVVLAMAARGVNRDGSAPKLGRILEIFAAHNPVNFGNVAGNSHTGEVHSLAARSKDNTVSHAVFRSEEDLVAVLEDLKREDLGVSIVVSGLFEEVAGACRKACLKPHTVNLSLGVWGKTDRLPSEGILEVATMCGHNMVAFGVIAKQVEFIRNGFVSAEDAAKKLARSCHCGVFNWERAARVLGRLAKEQQA